MTKIATATSDVDLSPLALYSLQLILIEDNKLFVDSIDIWMQIRDPIIWIKLKLISILCNIYLSLNLIKLFKRNN